MASPVDTVPVNRIDGAPSSLGDFAGQVRLVVNVASKCGLTPQYEGLESLQKTYSDKGFAVLGFPANNFGGQEPGTNEEIVEFCTTNFGVDFPMFEKISVTGEDKHPLYQALTAAQPEASGGGALRERFAAAGRLPADSADVLWNFEKFLVGKNGDVVARFAPDVKPEDPIVTAAIEAELAR
ncbi:glutathione peroxidase [Phenylobacterium immobile]|uniref:glutathione peroxidase n=1 Tax=Phenylobacterium immobile TaxID=21 RepID=UPI000A5A865C|nr:glutathione peroxidase [Phenylobacterium immobile]